LPMRLVLFDIDGTLISTAHAGMRAFYRALTLVYGLPIEDDPIQPDGKTDPLIAQECLASFGMGHLWESESRDRLYASYIDFLAEEMENSRRKGTLRVLPGVRPLLESLTARPGLSLGLVTGNLEQGAAIKLNAAGLAGFFHFGGYGSDSENRTELVQAAIRRGIRLAEPLTVRESIVIGDTPLDVLHGHAAGARVIAVASARYSLEELEASGPDLAVRDLTDTEALIRYLEN
jgi:phosphoglycolate phosphatase